MLLPQGYLQDMNDHFQITVSGGLRGTAKPRVGRQVGVTVDLDHVRRSVVGETHVHPGVSPAAYGCPRSPRGGGNPVGQGRRYGRRAQDRCMVVLEGLNFPFGRVGNDARVRIRKGAEVDFRQREHFRWVVPQRDVEFATCDERFREGSLVVPLHDIANAIP